MLDCEKERKTADFLGGLGAGGVFAALLWLLCVHVDLNVNI